MLRADKSPCRTSTMGTIDVVNDQRLRDIQREYLEFLEDEVRIPRPSHPLP